ncbi:MAG: hypothetical protein IPG22_06355 [Acidobacteria bacterium]|nr:hypothetical protein [Acidobacteriota bacterium]
MRPRRRAKRSGLCRPAPACDNPKSRPLPATVFTAANICRRTRTLNPVGAMPIASTIGSTNRPRRKERANNVPVYSAKLDSGFSITLNGEPLTIALLTPDGAIAAKGGQVAAKAVQPGR